MTKFVNNIPSVEYFLKKIKKKLHNTLLCYKKYLLKYISTDIANLFSIASYNSCQM